MPVPTHQLRCRRGARAAVAVALASTLALGACSSDSSNASGDSGEAAIDSLSIIVPADPGGGWDQTGRALELVSTEADFVDTASVENIGGAGGTVGLQALANESDPNTLMVTGLVMVGAVVTNKTEVGLQDTTPIARLTEEPLVVVVPADSKYQDLGDLVDDIVANGQAVSITGGSAGGADHILAGLLLSEAGLEGAEIPDKLNYVANSGGGEAVTLLLGNNASAGISGVGEFEQYVESGQMRALAVSSAEPSEQLPYVPTMKDAGYDVELTNWRGLVAPGNIDDTQKQALVNLATEVTGSQQWKDVLADKGWTDAFLPGDEFGAFLDTNITEVTDTLKSIGLAS